MKLIKAILFRLLSPEAYLTLVSKVYLMLMNAGLYKEKYAELHYINTVVQPGNVTLDLGANMGYYSHFMGKAAGKQGKVYAVEPIPLFAKINRKNTKGLTNVELYNVALGSEEGTLKMGTPKVNGVFRHGLTRVVSEEEAKEMELVYEVEVKVPDKLFANLTRLDFVKCDVEGFEVVLFPNLMSTLNKFKPVIQIEISGEENRKAMFDMLLPLGYRIYGLQKGKLNPLSEKEALTYADGDFYFQTNS